MVSFVTSHEVQRSLSGPRLIALSCCLSLFFFSGSSPWKTSHEVFTKENALLRFKKFSFRLFLRRLELEPIRFFTGVGAWVILVLWKHDEWAGNDNFYGQDELSQSNRENKRKAKGLCTMILHITTWTRLFEYWQKREPAICAPLPDAPLSLGRSLKILAPGCLVIFLMDEFN